MATATPKQKETEMEKMKEVVDKICCGGPPPREEMERLIREEVAAKGSVVITIEDIDCPPMFRVKVKLQGLEIACMAGSDAKDMGAVVAYLLGIKGEGNG
jgi:hypothetical protein